RDIVKRQVEYGVQSNRSHLLVVQAGLAEDRWPATRRRQRTDRARRRRHAPSLGRDARVANGSGRARTGVDRSLRRGAAVRGAGGRAGDADSTAAVDAPVRKEAAL